MPYMNPLLESLLSEDPFLDTNSPEAMDEYADTMQDQYLLQGGKTKVKHPLSADDEVMEGHYSEFKTKSLEELKQIATDEINNLLALNEENAAFSLLEVNKLKTHLFDSLDNKFNKPLNEALHFGKSSELIECGNLLEEVIQESKSAMPSIVEINKRIKIVENILEKYFNFGCLTLDFTGLNILGSLVNSKSADGKNRIGVNVKMLGTNFFTPNAYTLKKDTLSTIQHHFSNDPVKHFDTSNGRLAWNDSIRPMTYISITAGLAQIRNLTGEEMLAIVLHEIGHNFYRGSIVNRSFTVLKSAFSIVPILGLSALEWTSNNTLTKAEKVPALKSVIDAIYGIMLNFTNIFYSFKSVASPNTPLHISNRINNMLGPVGKVVKTSEHAVRAVLNFFNVVSRMLEAVGMVQILLTFGLGGALYLLLDQGAARLKALISFASMDGTGEEKFSDEFAAMHGYGPELISGLAKLSDNHSWESSKETDENGTDLLMFLAYINSTMQALYNYASVHPDNISRSYLLADYYRDQIKAARNSKEKRAIENEFMRVIKNSPAYKVSSSNDKKRIMQLIDTDIKTVSIIAENSGFVAVIREMLTFNGGSASEIDKLLMARDANS